MPPPIGPSSELTHAGRPYELTLLVSTVLVTNVAISTSKLRYNAYSLSLCRCRYISENEEHGTSVPLNAAL